jgi:subtilisin family serine protease
MPQITDQRYLDQWALVRIQAKVAWEQLAAKGSAVPVTVAIIDWGMQRNHREFGPGLPVEGARVIPPQSGNFSDADNFSDDSTNGHGTMLAGLIAGLVPDVRLLVVKFIDMRTTPDAENAAAAIRYALLRKTGPMVINASWDVSLDRGSLAKAIKEAREAGVPIVAGAGNDGRDNDKIPSLPATFVNPDLNADEFSNLISVMASDEEDNKPDFSNYGEKKVHLAAPGTRIISTGTYLGDAPSASPGEPYNPGYSLHSGTSPATAFVSAAAAMLLSLEPTFTPMEIRKRLVLSADRRDSLKGLCQLGGRLNLSRAVLGLVAPR